MSADESVIGNYFSRRRQAAEANDLPKMLDLIADGAVFLVAGREPFGKDEFARMQGGMRSWKLDFESSTATSACTATLFGPGAGLP